VIEALSTAYCRSVAASGASSAATGRRLVDFSRQVATVLAN
jgi:hypothetical protein